MKLFRYLILACTIAAIPALANDGATLIDQNSATAGNITPGDDPGFPITITLPGIYRLTGNLRVPDVDTSAIVIASPMVVIDLNGFSINGPVLCPTTPVTCLGSGKGVGIQATDPVVRGTRVMNGSIRGMGSQGIQLNGTGSSVEKVLVLENGAGGMSVEGSVTASTAVRNGMFGIIGTLIRDSYATENVGDGIILNSGGTAASNVSSYNGGFGFYIQFGTAIGNTAMLNTGTGLSALCPAAVTGNTIVASNGLGIQTDNAGCAVLNNAVR